MLKLSNIQLLVFLGFSLFAGKVAADDNRGQTVVVIYNTAVPDSKTVADHYAERRHVPARQILGLSLPTGETMLRSEYHDQLEAPLSRWLETNDLMVFEPNPSKSGQRQLKHSTIRYAVLCYGVPLRIAEDSSLKEPNEEKLRPELRRNGAAVDSELCLLPWPDLHRLLAAFTPNPLYGTTNHALLGPSHGLLMVTRLDGPNSAIAFALVDKAMQAETNGLWGRAYFDLRGVTNGPMQKGDEWLGVAAMAAHDYGFDTVVDNRGETFPAGFPASQIALYAGWYEPNVSGPFARPTVEFMPGAFAYHLHSFSAQTLREPTNRWCGPFLAKGVTATMGCIDEPYLDGTPNIGFFFTRFLDGFSFGEAAYACQGTLSWQTTVIGDPLYRPFGQDPRLLHDGLIINHNPLLEWSYLRIVNLSLLHKVDPQRLIPYLTGVDLTTNSAVLTEKLGELYQMAKQPNLALQSWLRALKLNPSPLQTVRLTVVAGSRLQASGRDAQALDLYDDFLKKNPTYPEAANLYTAMAKLADKMHQTEAADRYTRLAAQLNGAH